MPSSEQASFQLTPLLALPATCTRPFTASSDAGSTSSFLPTSSAILRKASCPARRCDSLTPPTVVLPPLAPLIGILELPMFTRIDSYGRPKHSARTSAITVRVPEPRSCVPQVVSTSPVGWTFTEQIDCPAPPPQVWIARPNPSTTEPLAAPLPCGCHLAFQSINFAAISISAL